VDTLLALPPVLAHPDTLVHYATDAFIRVADMKAKAWNDLVETKAWNDLVEAKARNDLVEAKARKALVETDRDDVTPITAIMNLLHHYGYSEEFRGKKLVLPLPNEKVVRGLCVWVSNAMKQHQQTSGVPLFFIFQIPVSGVPKVVLAINASIAEYSESDGLLQSWLTQNGHVSSLPQEQKELVTAARAPGNIWLSIFTDFWALVGRPWLQEYVKIDDSAKALAKVYVSCNCAIGRIIRVTEAKMPETAEKMKDKMPEKPPKAACAAFGKWAFDAPW